MPTWRKCERFELLEDRHSRGGIAVLVRATRHHTVQLGRAKIEPLYVNTMEADLGGQSLREAFWIFSGPHIGNVGRYVCICVL